MFRLVLAAASLLATIGTTIGLANDRTSAHTNENAVVRPARETAPVASADDAADDTDVWHHPTDATKSLIVATDKKAGLLLFDLAGKKVGEHPVGRINNIDSRMIRHQGQVRQLFIGTNRSTESLDLFWIVDGEVVERVGSIRARAEPYGVCVGSTNHTNQLDAYVTYKNGLIEQWRIQSTNSGFEAKIENELRLSSQVEGCVVHDGLERLFVGEEEVGVWSFDLRHLVAPPILVDRVGEGGHLAADVEGVTTYDTGAGTSFLLVSSQGDASFQVYDVQTGTHRGGFRIGASDLIDEVSETDGIHAVNLPLGAAFPRGVFIVQDGVNATSSGETLNQNFKLVDWSEIATTLGL